jgi:hypothetical protein
MKQRIADHSLGPIRFALVLGEQVGEFPQRPVRRHPCGRLSGNGRPSQTTVLLGDKRQRQGEYQNRGLHYRPRYHRVPAV